MHQSLGGWECTKKLCVSVCQLSDFFTTWRCAPCICRICIVCKASDPCRAPFNIHGYCSSNRPAAWLWLDESVLLSCIYANNCTECRKSYRPQAITRGIYCKMPLVCIYTDVYILYVSIQYLCWCQLFKHLMCSSTERVYDCVCV